MDKNESLLLEAVKNMLSDKAQLGLSIHNQEETSHNTQFHWQDVEDKFKIKINKPEISMFDSINGAFFHTHSYKNIDDPQFNLSFKKQMDGMVVPHSEQEIALKYLEELRKEFKMPTDGRHDKMQHNEFTNSEEETTGLQDQKDMAKATGHEA